MPDTTGRGASQSAPLVSVIIPARNEESNIATCLKSLVRQAGTTAPYDSEASLFSTSDGLAYEVIVVDDDSTDRTAAIAAGFPGVRVVSAGVLPAGWKGKCHACATGAKYARAPWLLFTDADTHHKPDSIARALAEAESHDADLLSYSPEQELTGVAQHALMPLIFAELATAYAVKDVCDPNSPVAAINGQYLLIKWDVYLALGGFGSVCGDLLEDVALARLAKSRGYRIHFRYGGDIVRTRMYRTFRDMCEGWTKNLVLLFPSAENLALRRALEFISTVVVACAALIILIGGARVPGLVTAVVSSLAFALLYRRVRKAHFGTLSTLISPLGLPLFSYLLLRSRISHKKGCVVWKDRIYTGSADPAEPAPSAETQSSGAVNG